MSANHQRFNQIQQDSSDDDNVERLALKALRENKIFFDNDDEYDYQKNIRETGDYQHRRRRQRIETVGHPTNLSTATEEELDENFFYEDQTDYGDNHVYDFSSDSDSDNVSDEDDDVYGFKSRNSRSGYNEDCRIIPDFSFLWRLMKRATPMHWFVIILSILVLLSLFYLSWYVFRATFVGKAVTKAVKTTFFAIRANWRAIIRRFKWNNSSKI